jgi:hypothetical protein
VVEGTTINATTARKLIANEDVMIYDNPQAFVLCHYNAGSGALPPRRRAPAKATRPVKIAPSDTG